MRIALIFYVLVCQLNVSASTQFVAFQNNCAWVFPAPKNVFFISPKDYAAYGHKIKIDTNTMVKDGHGCVSLWLIDDNNVTKFYRLTPEQLDLGEAKSRFRECNPSNYSAAPYDLILPVIDSLDNANVLYAVNPPISTNMRYRVSLNLYFNDFAPATNATYEQLRAINNECFRKFKPLFLEAYPEINDGRQIIFDDISIGMVKVLFTIDTSSFDFNRLEGLGVHYKMKPIVYPQYFRVMVYKPYAE